MDRPDDRAEREARERRAEDLRRRVQEIARGEPGERPSPRSPHEYIEERMREEAERLGDDEREPDGPEEER